MADIVYVLTNEAMPGLIKIGLTSDSVESRLTSLSSHTGVPLPFECYFAA
ncbi:MAG: GIY-YIG nuclease family protein, partial [Planctomycetia bacterium]|nr:GIY-YIG nuclease family protein [Planctomycetia bacterium]